MFIRSKFLTLEEGNNAMLGTFEVVLGFALYLFFSALALWMIVRSVRHRDWRGAVVGGAVVALIFMSVASGHLFSSQANQDRVSRYADIVQ